jgi:hypothetical protein
MIHLLLARVSVLRRIGLSEPLLAQVLRHLESWFLTEYLVWLLLHHHLVHLLLNRICHWRHLLEMVLGVKLVL